MEEQVMFRCQGLDLEARLDFHQTGRGAVVCHPHPLYGGNMDNPVVVCLARAFVRAGFASLRFNFRGTGKREGGFDEGRGEQDDVGAAVDYLRGRGCSEITLAGYSFGAWVNGLAGANSPSPLDQVMVSPPVGFLDFSPVKPLPGLVLAVAGDRDDFAPLDMLGPWIKAANPLAELAVIQGADHFYSNRLNRLEDVLDQWLGRYA